MLVSASFACRRAEKGNYSRVNNSRRVIATNIRSPRRGPILSPGHNHTKKQQCIGWLLDNSRIRQLADWTSRGCHGRLCVLSFRSFGGICETASCPVTVQKLRRKQSDTVRLENTITITFVFAARGELRKVVFLALSVTFLFVYEISREPGR